MIRTRITVLTPSQIHRRSLSFFTEHSFLNAARQTTERQYLSQVTIVLAFNAFLWTTAALAAEPAAARHGLSFASRPDNHNPSIGKSFFSSEVTWQERALAA